MSPPANTLGLWLWNLNRTPGEACTRPRKSTTMQQSHFSGEIVVRPTKAARLRLQYTLNQGWVSEGNMVSATSIAPESRRLEAWEAELAEIRAEVEREENLVTENDTPVDNILSEKQQRLLTEPLYGAWSGPDQHAPGHRGFLALANVGLFYALRQPPLVPDMMLALDVPGPGPDLSQKANRS